MNNPPAAAMQVVPAQQAVLHIGGQELRQVCHNSLQLALIALPGQDVLYRTGRISPGQVQSHRPSYINALLIQSRGAIVPGGGCHGCRTRGPSPFLECRRVPGHFGGCCGSCKWRDHAQRCTARDNNVVEVPDDSSDEDDNGPPPNDRGQRLLGPAGSQQNPLVLA